MMFGNAIGDVLRDDFTGRRDRPAENRHSTVMGVKVADPDLSGRSRLPSLVFSNRKMAVRCPRNTLRSNGS